MVDLLEYEGKNLFKIYSITVPSSYLIRNIKELKNINDENVVKAQVPTGHRGVNGGVIKIKNKLEAANAIESINRRNFNGFKPESFLIEKLVRHKNELYVGLTLDRSNKSIVLIVSPAGGVDIEKVPQKLIKKFNIDIFAGMQGYIKREAFKFTKLDTKYQESFYSLMDNLWKVFVGKDCELVEINPLAVTESELIALDSKITIEDDSLFRHPEYKKEYTSSDPIEAEAKRKNISFVRLDGNIGLIANGAGLTLATIDQIKMAGGNAGDFLDLGGTDDPSKVEEAINLVVKTKPKVIFINIFGGVTKADTVAKGIVGAIRSLKNITVVVRLKGINDEKGRQLLKANSIAAFTDISQAINKVVEVSKNGNINE